MNNPDNVDRAPVIDSDAYVEARIHEFLVALEYEGDPGYFDASRVETIPNYKQPIQQALANMGVIGCFGFVSTSPAGKARYTPIAYVAKARDRADADELHRKTWSQGIVPLLLVATPEGLQLRTSFRYQRGTAANPVSWDNVLVDGALHRTFAHLAARRLRGSLAWRDFTPAPADRVDSRLMTAITELSTSIGARSPGLKDRPELINAVIARMIYLFVLVDRRVIDQAWVDGLERQGRPACGTIRLDPGPADARWAAGETWFLLDAIDGALNGTVFPISTAERALIPEGVLHDVRRVVRNGDVLLSGSRKQTSFLDVSFATLRTETVSAIYELFLNLQDAAKQKQDGAFYTPPFIADYVLDEMDGFAPFDGESRVLDSAAGSGVFLVGAYRRIVEACAPAAGWSIAGLPTLRELLIRCVFGVERNPQAANVARLSLYLTLLDYAGGATLSAIREALGDEKLFPPLSVNISTRDFFDPGEVAGRPSRSFTHIVGNPPWGKLSAGEAAVREYASSLSRADYPVDYFRVEELFAWKLLRDEAAPGAAVALLLSTRCFVNAGAQHFSTALARRAKIVGLTNLSHFRYRLFENARSPATILFAIAAEADDLDAAWVYAPLLTSQPVSASGAPWAIVADRGTYSHVRHAELRTTSRAWSRTLMLQPFDRRNAVLIGGRAAAEEATFGHFLVRSDMFVTRGVTPSETDLPINLVLTGDKKHERYYRSVLGLEEQEGLPLATPPTASYHLDEKRLRQLPERYRRLFGGNVLAVSRHMVHFDILDAPVALNPSINIIAFKAETSASELPRRRDVLAAVERYLRSDVADYMFALTGKTWLLDGRRFEKNDLLALPFPFRDADAAGDPANGEADLTLLLRDRLGLPSDFGDAVRQYGASRRGYQDAQVPADAFDPPGDAVRKGYLGALEAELAAALGPRADLAFNLEALDAGDFDRITLTIGLRKHNGKMRAESPVPLAVEDLDWTGFNHSCVVGYEPRTSTVTMVKPRTTTAWTADRAYADNLRILEMIASL